MNFKLLNEKIEKIIGEFQKTTDEKYIKELEKIAMEEVKVENFEEYAEKYSIYKTIEKETWEKIKNSDLSKDLDKLYKLQFCNTNAMSNVSSMDSAVAGIRKDIFNAMRGLNQNLQAMKKEQEVKEKEKSKTKN